MGAPDADTGISVIVGPAAWPGMEDAGIDNSERVPPFLATGGIDGAIDRGPP
ncbi:MAG: hypothetical protein ACK55I_28795 [bacterium]